MATEPCSDATMSALAPFRSSTVTMGIRTRITFDTLAYAMLSVTILVSSGKCQAYHSLMHGHAGMTLEGDGGKSERKGPHADFSESTLLS